MGTITIRRRAGSLAPEAKRQPGLLTKGPDAASGTKAIGLTGTEGSMPNLVDWPEAKIAWQAYRTFGVP